MKKRPRPYKRPDSPIYWGRDPNTGKRLSLKTEDRDTAQAVLDALYAEYKQRNMLALDTSRATLGRFHREWIDHLGGLEKKSGLVSLETRKRYDLSLRMLIQGLGERTLLRNLTAKKIASWSRSRLAGEIRGQGKKPVPMSPQGVNSDLRSIKAALATAVDWGWLDRAPKIKLLRVPDSPPRHLIPEEIDALMKALPKGWTKAKRDQCNQLWTFCLFTACRRSEALGLTWEQVSLGKTPMARIKGKGGKIAPIPLLPQAVEAMGEPKDSGPVFLFPRSDRPTRAEIRRMQKAYSNTQLARRLGVSDVCIGRWSRTKEPEPYAPHPDTISHWFKAQARAAGLRLPRLHDMRHTAVTYMLAKGVAPRLVQRIARHSSFSTTEQYAKGDMDMLYDEMISKVGNGQSRTKLSRGLFLVNDSNDIT